MQSTDIKSSDKEPENIEINEDKINRLLHLLHEADPTNPDTDTQEMLKLEKEVDCMGPLIDSELERVDRKHAQLTQLSADLVEALGLYHGLMREPQFAPKMPYYGPAAPVSMGPPSYNGAMSLPPQQTPQHGMMPAMGPPPAMPQSGHDRQPFMGGPMPMNSMMPPYGAPATGPVRLMSASSLPPFMGPMGPDDRR